MKKFFIKDSDGDRFEVEELEEERTQDEELQTEEKVIEGSLTSEEILALKKLVPIADKLIEMFGKTTTEEDGNDDDQIDDEDEDEVLDADEDEFEEKTEKVIKTGDSKKSFGSIERKRTGDSLDSKQLSVEDAWAKRYGRN